MANRVLSHITFGSSPIVTAARVHGLLDAEGLDAEVIATPNSTEQMRGLGDGKYDIASTNFDNVMAWSGRDAELLKPTKLELEDYGHSLSGAIYWFDRDVNFAVPKKPVPQALVTYQQLGPNAVGGVRTLIAQAANAEGRFRFDIMRNKLDNTIKAYELDEWGEIVSAPDMGQEGNETYPMLHA